MNWDNMRLPNNIAQVANTNATQSLDYHYLHIQYNEKPTDEVDTNDPHNECALRVLQASRNGAFVTDIVRIIK